MENHEQLEKFGTLRSWEREFKISKTELAARLKGTNNVEGRLANGRVQRFYGEEVVRERCADLLTPLPKADEAGFAEIDGERYASRNTWATLLGLSENLITRCLRDAPAITVRYRGRTLQNGFFSESTVRERTHGLTDIPQADMNGFFTCDEGGIPIRYGSREAWAKYFGISTSHLSTKIVDLQGISARNAKDGRLYENAYFAEQEVLDACKTIQRDLPQAEENGFLWVEQEGERRRYGNVNAWARELKTISPSTIIRRLLDVRGIEAKDASGRPGSFYYDEDSVRNCCADLLVTMPTADASGFVLFGEERYATPKTWAKEFPLSDTHIRNALQGTSGLTARSANGNVIENGYFAESDVKRTCGKHLDVLPQTNPSGFFLEESGATRYGHLKAWSDELGLHINTIKVRLANTLAISGKDSRNRIVDLYSEQQVRQACADILSLPCTDSSGFFMHEGVRYGTIRAWTSVLRVSRSVIERRLGEKTGITGRGANGRVEEQGFFSEEIIRETCNGIFPNQEYE